MRSSGSGGSARRHFGLRQPAGFTLFEMLVAATLTLVLFVMIFQFLVPAMHAYLRGTTRVSLQQAAMLAMTRICSDLQNTTPASVAVKTDPTVLGMNRILTVTDNGAQVWEPKLIVYAFYPADHVLRRIECPPPPPATTSLSFPFNSSVPYTPTFTDLHNVAFEGRGTVLSSDVVEFTIQGVDFDGRRVDIAGGVTDPLAVTLRLLHREAHQEQPETFTLERTVALKQRI